MLHRDKEPETNFISNRASAASVSLANRVGRIANLSPGEVRVLQDLQSNRRTFRRGRKLLTEGTTPEEMFLVLSGIGIRYRVLNDGRRQISRLVLPEDVVGYVAAATGRVLFSTLALTDMVVAAIPRARLADARGLHSSLLVKLLFSFACDAAIDAERIVDLGRRPALERIAHFLMELLTRFQAIGMADDCSFEVPLTQDLICDALGLSETHVGRVFRFLRTEKLAYLNCKRVVIADVAALSDLADFDAGYLRPRAPSEIFDRVA